MAIRKGWQNARPYILSAKIPERLMHSTGTRRYHPDFLDWTSPHYLSGSAGWPRFGSVALRFIHGTGSAIPVFSSDGSSGKGISCISVLVPVLVPEQVFAHLKSKFSVMFSCEKGQTSGSNITKKMFWWNYFCYNYKDCYKGNRSEEICCNNFGQDGSLQNADTADHTKSFLGVCFVSFLGEIAPFSLFLSGLHRHFHQNALGELIGA